MSEEGKYRQLALFSIILMEVVLLPASTGGLVYWLTRESSARGIFAILGALIGLVAAFYRISKMMKKAGSDGSEGK